MKRILFVFMSIIFVVFCIGCSDVSETIIIDKVSEYSEIWNLTGRNEEKSVLFPEDISGMNVVNFRCEWVQYYLLDCGFETILTIQYDKKSFEKRENEISDICVEKNIEYETEVFEYPAYVTILGEDCTCEYVLLDKENLQMHYIYVQFMNKKDIDFNEKYLPKGYNYGDVKGYSYSIY